MTPLTDAEQHLDLVVVTVRRCRAAHRGRFSDESEIEWSAGSLDYYSVALVTPLARLHAVLPHVKCLLVSAAAVKAWRRAAVAGSGGAGRYTEPDTAGAAD